MKKTIYLLALLLFAPFFSEAQDIKTLDRIAEQYAQKTFPLLQSFLRLPNDANKPLAYEANMLWSEEVFQDRGFKTTRINTAAAPLLLAEKVLDPDLKTVLFYVHVDGQPVDPSQWEQENPYEPVVKKQNDDGQWEALPWDSLLNYKDDWRIYARSASDAKGPVIMFLAALDAIKELGKKPNFNLKIIVDFEEELGSPNLPLAVLENKELLKADNLVIFDGPQHRSNQPTLSFGARGIATAQLTTYGPIVPQHSGHFGNYVPNPALRLSRLLASMKSEDGKVIIPGFYDGIVIDSETEETLKSTPFDKAGFMDAVQIAAADQVGSYYHESIQFPSLNIRGMQSGEINEKARTIIPAWAKAEIDVRLVLESNPERLLRLVKEHIEKQGYYVIDRVPTKEERLTYPKIATYKSKVSYQSFRTPFDSKIGVWLTKSMKRAFDQEPIRIRMSGGSIPISPFVLTLGIPAVAVPTVNPDNNQHSPNENIRLGNYRDGIKTMIALLTEKL